MHIYIAKTLTNLLTAFFRRSMPCGNVFHLSIEIALTIEPADTNASSEEAGNGNNLAPTKRLKAFQIVKGYMIPDPDVPSRLSVWFTGGKLSPASRVAERTTTTSDDGSTTSNSDDSDFEEWTKIFGNSSSTWTESIANMSAKLLLGAELPSGMNEVDGSMSYALHRPYGGHGKAYVDILYLDDDLYVTKGNSGTIHVAVRSSLFLSPTPPPPPPLAQPATTEPRVLEKKKLATTSTSSQSVSVGITTKQHQHQQVHVGQKRKFAKETDEEASNAQQVVVDPASTTTVEAENVPSSTDYAAATTTPKWKISLQQDFNIRGSKEVAKDLTDVLAAYGLQLAVVIPKTTTTKRTKYNS